MNKPGYHFDIDQLPRDDEICHDEPAIELCGWVRVSERMPSHGQWVRVFGPGSRTSSNQMIARCVGVDWEWESADDGFRSYINPTHWTHITDDPKEIA